MAKRVSVGSDAAANEAAAAALAAEPTDKRLTFDAMLKHYNAAADKELIFSYLMRAWPACDQRRVTGPKGHINIDKVAGVFTREYILAKHGNGAYQISFHDDSRPRAKRRVGIYNFEIQEPGVLPLCDPRAVLWNDPRNAQYVEALRSAGALPVEAITEINGAAPAPAVAAPAVAVAPAPSLKAQVIELMDVQRLLGVGGAAGGSGGGSDGGLKDGVLLPLFNTMAQTNITLMTRLQEMSLNGGAPAGRGGLGELKELMGFLISMGWAPPGGAPAAAAAAALASPAGAEPQAESGLGSIMSGLNSLASVVRDAKEMFFAMRGAPVSGGDGGAVVETGTAVAAVPPTQEENMLAKIQQFGGYALDAFLQGTAAAAFMAQAETLPDGVEMVARAREFGPEKLKAMLAFVPGLSERLAEQGKTMDEAKRWIDAAFAGKRGRK